MNPLLYIATFAISAYVLLNIVQPRPSFLLLLPIILLTVGVGWYLNKHIQKEHENNLKKGFRYEVEEQEAQHWLHQSFAPKTTILLKQHIKEFILYSGILLIVFVFFWSYLVAGLSNAILSASIALLLYSTFIFYTLHADKWYRYAFKRIPKHYRHYKNNDWVHGFIILLPFTFLCFLFYLAFNYQGSIINTLLAIPLFFVIYSLLFISMYCGMYTYNEYKKDEEKKLKEAMKEMIEKES